MVVDQSLKPKRYTVSVLPRDIDLISLRAGIHLMWDWGGVISFDVATGPNKKLICFPVHLHFSLGRTLTVCDWGDRKAYGCGEARALLLLHT